MIIKRSSRGFTLIELMIAVAIVGILSAVAMPSYENYTAKAKLSEGFAFLERAKLDVEIYYREGGSLSSLTDSNFSTKLDLPKSIDTDLINEYWIAPWGGHDITIWFLTKLTAPVPSSAQRKWPFYLAGNIGVNNKITWQCIRYGIPDKYMPPGCE